MGSRMALEPGVDSAESAEFGSGEIPAARQHAVPYRRNMTVGKKEEVFAAAFHTERLLVPHDFKIEGHHEIGTAEGATGMTALALVNHADDVAPHLTGDALEFLNIRHDDRLV